MSQDRLLLSPSSVLESRVHVIVCDDHHGRLVPRGRRSKVVVHEDTVHHRLVLRNQMIVVDCGQATIGDVVRLRQFDRPATPPSRCSQEDICNSDRRVVTAISTASAKGCVSLFNRPANAQYGLFSLSAKSKTFDRVVPQATSTASNVPGMQKRNLLKTRTLAPEVPKHCVVSTGRHDPSFLPSLLCDPREVALHKVCILRLYTILELQPKESWARSALPHP